METMCQQSVVVELSKCAEVVCDTVKKKNDKEKEEEAHHKIRREKKRQKIFFPSIVLIFAPKTLEIGARVFGVSLRKE